MASASSPPLRRIFVFGCPRSGTSALVRLLCAHPRVVIGMERYRSLYGRAAKHVKFDEMSPALFEPTRFLEFRPGDTPSLPVPVGDSFAKDGPGHGRHYAVAAERLRHGDVAAIGDKVMPAERSVLRRLAEVMPESRFVFIYRDPLRVASSFCVRAADPEDRWPAENTHRRAVELWQESFSAASEVFDVVGPAQVVGFRYETLFAGDVHVLQALFEFCLLGVPPQVQRRFARQTEHWEQRQEAPLVLDDDQRRYVTEHVDLAPMERFDRRWARLSSDATA